MPEIIINDTIFFSSTAIRILVISNHKSFRMLFDKIASKYLIWKKGGAPKVVLFSTHYVFGTVQGKMKWISLNITIGNGQPREPALSQLYRLIFVPYHDTIRHEMLF